MATSQQHKMTEDQIERLVERQIDHADSALMNGRITQIQYDRHMKAINRWAERAYNRKG